MATTFAELEARIRGLEVRAQKNEEDITAIVSTVVDTRDDVGWLKREVTRANLRWETLLNHFGLADVTDEQVDAVLEAEG